MVMEVAVVVTEVVVVVHIGPTRMTNTFHPLIRERKSENSGQPVI